MDAFHNKIISIRKDELAGLPAAIYQGNICLIDSPDAVAEAVEILSKEKCIGFDTETKPSFKKGQTNTVALLQLATHSHCFLFRLNMIGMPDSVKALLENENIHKIGLSIHDDFLNLRKICNFEPAGFIDLQSFVKSYHIADNSLTRIYAILFGERISKGQRLTNWEASVLTPHQQAYAALDALACLRIYDSLNEGVFDPVQSQYLRPIEMPETPDKI